MIVKRYSVQRCAWCRIVLMLKQAFCDENHCQPTAKKWLKIPPTTKPYSQNHSQTWKKNNTLKRNESIIELCNMLIYFVRLKISTRCKLQNNTYTLEGRKETRTPYHNTIGYEWRKHFLRSLQIMNYFRARFYTNKLLLENHHSRWRWIYRELLLLNWRYSNTMCSCFFFSTCV